MFVVINFITVMWYNPNLDQDCPPWVYASCALGLFLYQTFDAVDGMQAYVFNLAAVLRVNANIRIDEERDKVVRWESFLITVCSFPTANRMMKEELIDLIYSRCRCLQHWSGCSDLCGRYESRSIMDDIFESLWL